MQNTEKPDKNEQINSSEANSDLVEASEENKEQSNRGSSTEDVNNEVEIFHGIVEAPVTRKKFFKKIYILPIALAGIVVIAGISWKLIYPKKQYEKAESLYEEQEWEEASVYYEKAGKYNDAQEKYVNCGTQLYSSGDYKDAEKILIKLKGKNDRADEYLDKTYVALAEKNYANEKYAKALEYIEKCEDTEETKDLKENAEHMLAVQEDKTPPVLENVPDTTTWYRGFDFDQNTWVSDNQISVSDDVTEYATINIDTSNLNTDEIGTYTINCSATDEAGNTTNKEVSVSVERKIYSEDEIITALKTITNYQMHSQMNMSYYPNNSLAVIALAQEGIAELAGKAQNSYYLQADWRELQEKIRDQCVSLQSDLHKLGYEDIVLALVSVDPTNPNIAVVGSIGGAVVENFSLTDMV